MKLSVLTAFVLLSGSFFFAACKTQQKTLSLQEITALPKVLEFSKSGCRGKCPVFDLTIYENGWMVFDGRYFTKYEGKATDQLSKEEFVQLQKNCTVADLWSHRSEYGMNIMDIPTTTIHIHEKGKDKKIQYRMRAPEQLPTLSNQIMELMYTREWLEPMKKDRGIKMPPGAIHDEIIVQFKEKINATKWCVQYERYDIKVKKTISPSTPMYLIQFDTGKMSPDKMLEIIRSDASVKAAEFNKRMSSKRQNR